MQKYIKRWSFEIMVCVFAAVVLFLLWAIYEADVPDTSTVYDVCVYNGVPQVISSDFIDEGRHVYRFVYISRHNERVTLLYTRPQWRVTEVNTEPGFPCVP